MPNLQQKTRRHASATCSASVLESVTHLCVVESQDIQAPPTVLEYRYVRHASSRRHQTPNLQQKIGRHARATCPASVFRSATHLCVLENQDIRAPPRITSLLKLTSYQLPNSRSARQQTPASSNFLLYFA